MIRNVCKIVLLVINILSVVRGKGLVICSLQHQFPTTGDDGVETSVWRHACAAVLLKKGTAVTSASCLSYSDESEGLLVVSPDEVRVYAGDGDPDNLTHGDLKHVRDVKKIIIHPEYFLNKKELVVEREFDFGICFLKRPFNQGDLNKIVTLFSNDVDAVRKRLNDRSQFCSTQARYFYVDGNPVPLGFDGEEIPVKMIPIEDCDAALNNLNAFPEDKRHLKCVIANSSAPICRIDPGSPVLCGGKLIALVTNSGLMCGGGDANVVVVTGINNALVFLAEPSIFDSPKIDSIEMIRQKSKAPAKKWSTHVIAIMIVKYLMNGWFFW